MQSPNRSLAEQSLQLSRRMVGQNELQMARDSATQVFRKHGGAYDQDGAPVLGACADNNCQSQFSHCDTQRLAFSVLLSLSVFETAREMFGR